MMKLIYKSALILGICSALSASGQPRERHAFPLDTVARIGLDVVTGRDLLERLELMPFPRKDKPSQRDSAKVRALLGLVAEKVLAQEARRLHLDKSPTTARMREGLEDLFIRDEMFRREVVQKVNPTEEEIYTGLQRFAVELKVVAFMTDSEIKSKNIAAQLRRKTGIAGIIQQRTVLEVDTITATFGVLEPDVERAVFSLDTSRVSESLYRPQSGWVVFYLLERHRNPAMDKMDLPSRRSHVEKIIRAYKQRVQAEEYSFSVLQTKHAFADSNVFNMLADSIVAFWKTSPLHYRRNGVYILSSDMVDVLLDRCSAYTDTVLVTSDEGNLTLGQILEMFRYENFSSPDIEGMPLKILLNETIKGIVGKRLLAREGRKQHYQNTAAVQQDLRRWTDYWAGGMLYNHVRDTIAVTNEEVIQYLVSHKNIYGNSYEVNVREILCQNLYEIETLINEYRQGTRFDSLASRNSRRTEWAKQGGESGFFKLKQHPEIGFHAMEAEPGKLVGPYKLPEGYSIFIVLAKRKDDAVAEYSSLKQSVHDQVLQEKQKQTMDRYIARLAREQQVRINYENLKKIEMKPIQMFTRRFIGFGGTMTAVPLLRFQWDWIKEFEKPITVIP